MAGCLEEAGKPAAVEHIATVAAVLARHTVGIEQVLDQDSEVVPDRDRPFVSVLTSAMDDRPNDQTRR